MRQALSFVLALLLSFQASAQTAFPGLEAPAAGLRVNGEFRFGERRVEFRLNGVPVDPGAPDRRNMTCTNPDGCLGIGLIFLGGTLLLLAMHKALEK